MYELRTKRFLQHVGWETEGCRRRQWRRHDPCRNNRGVPQPFRQEHGPAVIGHGAKSVSPGLNGFSVFSLSVSSIKNDFDPLFQSSDLAMAAANPERGPVRELDDGARRRLRAERRDEGRPAEEGPRPEAARRGNHQPVRRAQPRPRRPDCRQ
jgi:hypothetical protein